MWYCYLKPNQLTLASVRQVLSYNPSRVPHLYLQFGNHKSNVLPNQYAENNNYGIRKNLLEYDIINNQQREIIYAERRKVLDGESMRDTIYGMIDEVIEVDTFSWNSN